MAKFLRVKFTDNNKLPRNLYGLPYEDWKTGKAYTARREIRPNGVFYEVFYPGSPGGGSVVPESWVEVV